MQFPASVVIDHPCLAAQVIRKLPRVVLRESSRSLDLFASGGDPRQRGANIPRLLVAGWIIIGQDSDTGAV